MRYFVAGGVGAIVLGCAGLSAPTRGSEPPAPAPAPPAPAPPDEDHGEPEGPDPGDTVDGPVSGLPSPRPAPGQEVIPVLVRPFHGDFPSSGFLDHDQARAEGQLTPWGDIVGGKSGHKGHDWAMPVGTPLYAVAVGTVVRARDQGRLRCGKSWVESSILVELRHPDLVDGDDFTSVYLHMSKLDVAEGQRVEAGQRIGWSGNTGCSSGPHLHFGIIRQDPEHPRSLGHALDPYGWAGEGQDPWDPDRDGRSPWLWKDGEAPAIFRISARRTKPERPGPVVRSLVGTTWREDPQTERVVVGVPRGGGPDVDLGGWSLGDADRGVRWVFPKGTVLRPGSLLTVVTGDGTDTADVLHMGRAKVAWHAEGACVELRDRFGARVDALPVFRDDDACR